MESTLSMIVIFCLVAVSVASYVPPTPDNPCDALDYCHYPKGYCVTEGDDARCECFCGYKGYQCSVYDPSGCVCDDKDCGYGYCRELGYGQYVCQCHPGYYGPACQYEYYNPCKGYCKVGECKLDEYYNPVCKCPYGFAGDRCEEDVNECTESNIDCNYGTCVNEIGFYYCKCNSGYYGDFCDNKKFSCSYNESPCDPLKGPHKYYYTHKNSAYFVQCDDFGKCFDRPCAPGTHWDKSKNTCA